MNESVGYTVTINIVITFIVIVFVFLSNVIIYYKSNKVGNIITKSIEKHSGFNELSKQEIERGLDSIGYNKTNINCADTVQANENKGISCSVQDKERTQSNGYCVYYCNAEDNYYYYKVKANMIINIPIINDILSGSIFSSTINMYNFEGVIIGDVDENKKLENADLDLIQNYIDGLVEFSIRQKWLADLDADGEVTTEDIESIRQILLNGIEN